MPKFINLQRRFRNLTDAELEDTEHLVSFGEYGVDLNIGWPELLRHARVILLAEAGAGKTMEMEEQAKRLVADGRFAFFVALESLDSEPYVCLLSSADKEKFEAWKADRNQPAWFFLDSVDELKLREGTLDRALRHLSNAIDGYIDRTRVIISCRPSDWRPNTDLTTVLDSLPVPEREGDTSSQLPDQAFIGAFGRDLGFTNAVAQEDDELADGDHVRKVTMLPMSETQIKLFAENSGMNDAAAFLAEIDRQNAWTFARRPLDLDELIEAWKSTKRLGTRVQQHKAHIKSKLLDEPDRPDSYVLTDDEARLGAERLALALTLTRTRTIRSPERTSDIHRSDAILDPSTILKNWTDKKRRALLRRALFDPATYGRVRFHHRSIQEYLAARRLRALREKGMSAPALLRLLFTERYGVEVVRPSMRAIAASLALWDDAVCQGLTKREPETLLSLGDPETLSITARSNLVRAFVAAYGKGGCRGLDIPIDQIRRLADPDLAPVIRECWDNGPVNDEVHELLLEMIRLGPVNDCADLANTVARDLTRPLNHRISAIRALIACDKEGTVRELADKMLIGPASWTDEIVHFLAAELFPRFITVDGLVTLMKRSHEPRRVTENFDWGLRQIAETIEPWSETAIALRDNMADLIWRGREDTQEPYQIRGQFDYLAPALAMLCDRQLSEVSEKARADLIHACVIASRFGGSETGVYKPVGKLRTHFDKNPALRSETFWAELAFMDEITPADDDWQRYCRAHQNGLTGHLTERDRSWLELGLADESRPERRAVALHALIGVWRQRGRVDSELDAIRAIVKDDSGLCLILMEHTAPPEPDEETERMRREAPRMKNWRKWRVRLLANPADAFSAENQGATLLNIYSWLRAFKQNRNCHNVWDKNALTQEFGSDIAERAETAFRELWRTEAPILWSARPAAERNVMPYDWILGLLGVSVEATTPDWTASLSSGEARTAAAYATIELNGFAPFIADLAKSHPDEVDEVVGGEVSTELGGGGEHDHLPTLQNLTYADGNLKQLLIPRLLDELKSWPSNFADNAGPRWAVHIDRVLRVLDETNNKMSREAIAEECAKRYEADPVGVPALVWLRALFQFDAVRGTRALLKGLADSGDPDTHKRAVRTFAELFAHSNPVVFEIANRAQKAEVLKQLVRCAYAFIRREDDQVREGIYTPDTRDEAEDARSFLLSRLLDTPGPEAYRAIRALAEEDDFAHFSDRLRLLARQRAADDAEFPPYGPEDVLALENRYEVPPRDRDDLFDLMMDRLEDLAYYYAHDDFSNRRTVQNIAEEPEMQRTLAGRLKDKANGAYSVAREEEVADRKKTDIRLSTVNGDQKAVVEVKIADRRWSLTNLEQALRNQLVGQYLRDANCKAGCLLLTCHNKEKYWIHPDTRKRLKFSEIVTFLNEKATALEEEKLHDVRVAVFGLDLTDPPLAPAHHGS